MHRSALVALLAAALVLSGCAPAGDRETSHATSEATSDATAPVGVREVAEPPLHATTLASDGTISHRDLTSGAVTTIGRIAPADHVITDGRYLFAAREGSVTIVDSGVWTWSHGDHFHYYAGPARVVGDVDGPGVPTVVTGDRSTGIHFAGGEDVLVKAAPLGDGLIEELFRRPAASGAGLVVPLACGAWVSERGAGGDISVLREVDEDGVNGDATPCADAEGSIATVVGVVVACADGAVLAVDGRPAGAEVITSPVPDDRVRAFSGRKGRPTVSALSDRGDVWTLDTRARQWHRWQADTPLREVSAVGDAGGHVVAVTGEGDVVVQDEETGVVRSRPDVRVSARSTVVPERTVTYVADPRGEVLVLNHADGAILHRLAIPAGTTVITGR